MGQIRYIVVLCLLALSALGSATSTAAEMVQVVRPDGVGLVLTGIDTSQNDALEGNEVGLWMINPSFTGNAEAKGKVSTVVTVEHGKVVAVLRSEGEPFPTVPAAPVDGYVLIGSGIGHKFLAPIKVGDELLVETKERPAFEGTPAAVATAADISYPIDGLNRGRRGDELILFTPAFGTHTLTNGWGVEAAVANGEVVALRSYRDQGLFRIPANGFVISAHGKAREWFEDNVSLGAKIALVGEAAEKKAEATISAESTLPKQIEQEGASLQLPIVNTPFQHEEEQFGYNPWLVRNEVSFDSLNRPYIRSRTSDLHETGFIQTMQNGRWVEKDFTAAVRQAYPSFDSFVRGGGWINARIVFDAEDHLYTLVRIKLTDSSEHNLLLYSTDYADTFQVYDLPDGEFDIEHWVGHNSLSRPPLIAIHQKRAPHPKAFASYYNFFVIQPQKQGDKLVFSDPVFVTKNSLGPSRHSGHASFAVSTGDAAFITWFEVGDESLSGAPTYVASYDAITNTVGEPRLLAYAPPVNDGHNGSGICIDGQGYLHVISGSHGANFYYARSLQPYSADDGWTKPTPVLTTGAKGRRSGSEERGRQTYLAFVCDANDTLHIVYRQWREGVDQYFDGTLYGALSYQQKPVDGPWSEPTVLVVPPVPIYSVFYHKLTLDRKGRLFLSYSFRSPEGPYGGTYEDYTHFYDHRAMLFSPDLGQTWRLATSADFAAGEASDRQIAPGKITGRVVDEVGAPLPQAEVLAGPKVTYTDSNGSFSLDDVYLEEVNFAVNKEGYYPWQSVVTVPELGAAEVDVVLDQVDEVPVDLAQLWEDAFKAFVKLEDGEGEWRIKFLNHSAGGFGFNFDEGEGWRGLKFEARLEAPADMPDHELQATVTSEGHQAEERLLLDHTWQEYVLTGSPVLTRLNFLLEQSKGVVIGTRNVRLLK